MPCLAVPPDSDVDGAAGPTVAMCSLQTSCTPALALAPHPRASPHISTVGTLHLAPCPVLLHTAPRAHSSCTSTVRAQLRQRAADAGWLTPTGDYPAWPASTTPSRCGPRRVTPRHQGAGLCSLAVHTAERRFPANWSLDGPVVWGPRRLVARHRVVLPLPGIDVERGQCTERLEQGTEKRDPEATFRQVNKSR